MKVLRDFIHGFDFVRMKPDDGVIKGGLPGKGRARVLAEPGKQYAAYLFGGPEARLELALPKGSYRAEWLDPVSGKGLKEAEVNATGPLTALPSPRYSTDIVLRLLRAR
jgi:hypothetical protein